MVKLSEGKEPPKLHWVPLCSTVFQSIPLCFTVRHCIPLCFTVFHYVSLCSSVFQCGSLSPIGVSAVTSDALQCLLQHSLKIRDDDKVSGPSEPSEPLEPLESLEPLEPSEQSELSGRKIITMPKSETWIEGDRQEQGRPTDLEMSQGLLIQVGGATQLRPIKGCTDNHSQVTQMKREQEIWG